MYSLARLLRYIVVTIIIKIEMKKDRYLELNKMTMEELMHPSVSMSEFDFMLENVGKKIEEIQFED